MDRGGPWRDEHEAAVATGLELRIVRAYTESALIGQAEGYGEADLAELRRIRRLVEDLELEHPAIEVVLRMRRRLLALQAEVQRLESELRRSRAAAPPGTWLDAEWTDTR